MPRSFNQKLKILYLMKAFEEKTDREHPISVAEIIKYMDSYGSVWSVRLSTMI